MGDFKAFPRDRFNEQLVGLAVGDQFVVKSRSVGASTSLAPVYMVAELQPDCVIAEQVAEVHLMPDTKSEQGGTAK